MADIFGRTNQQFQGAFPVDGARVAFAGSDGNLLGVGLVTQNIGFNYAQPITVLFEVGTNNAYVVGGRSRGSANMSRVLGPRAFMPGFYQKYGNVCNMATNILNLDARSAACIEGSGANTFVLGIQYAVITNLQGTVNSENGLMTEGVALQYLTLTQG